MRSFRYAHIDPLNSLGPALDRRSPVETCCCCCCKCSRTRGLYWALGAFTCEAVWHITTSFLRPAIEWNSTNIIVDVVFDRIFQTSASVDFGFILQNLIRIFLLALIFTMWKALRAGKDGTKELRVFLRGLMVLFVFECFDMALQAVSVHNICDAPAVWRGVNNSMNEFQCELIADVYDYVWGFIVLCILGTTIRVVHSHLVALGGATWERGGQQQCRGMATGSRNLSLTSPLVEGVP